MPGPSLSLVLIDRIPFPRPDDPLLTARQRAVAARGGNGFMAVAASHAALLLAQGAGRLLRGVRRPRGGCGARLADGDGAVPGSCGRRCRRSGRPPTPTGSGRRWNGSRYTAYRRSVHYRDAHTSAPAPNWPTSRTARSSRRLRRTAGGVVLDDGEGHAGLGVRRSVQGGGHARHRRPDRPASRRPEPSRDVKNTDNGEIDELGRSSVSDIEEFWEARTPRRSTTTSPPSRRSSPGTRRDSKWVLRARTPTAWSNAGYCFVRPHHRVGPRRAAAALRRQLRRHRRHDVLAHEYGHAIQRQARAEQAGHPDAGGRAAGRLSGRRRTCAGSPRATPPGSPSAPATG